MERILEASAELLHETGLDGFNTNLLAECAGVSVRAIYRYFPNKHAILVALAERFREPERAWVGDLSAIHRFADWREAVDSAIDGYFAAASTQHGYPALRAAAQAVPRLREIDAEARRENQADLAVGLASLGIALSPERLAALCRTILEASGRLLDVALQAPPLEAALLVRELKLMIASLLANYMKFPADAGK